ncbi:MAG TPA: hypothetical protein VLQ65_06395 [Saliniramus sp.]|nr:hypothetical protein [Saliniramus sp.]
MFGFLKVRRGRRAAVETLAPFVARSRSRNPHIPENVWLSPYLVGLMGALITLAAKRRTGALDPQNLAIVQAQAWSALTEIEGDLFGDEMYLLSTDPDEAFKSGCRNAAELFGLISGELVSTAEQGTATDHASWSNAFWHMPRPDDEVPEAAIDPVFSATGDAFAMWDACFEAHLEHGRADARPRS